MKISVFIITLLLFFSFAEKAAAYALSPGCEQDYQSKLQICQYYLNINYPNGAPQGWELRSPYVLDVNEQPGGGTVLLFAYGCWVSSQPLFTGFCYVSVDDYKSPARPPQTPICPVTAKGSIIDVETQTLGESIPLVGSEISLHYRSDRTHSRIGDNTLHIPLLSATPDPNISGVGLEVTVAGRVFTQSFSATPNLNYDFVWDGLDNNGQIVQGKISASVKISMTYSNGAADYPIIQNYQIGSYGVNHLGLGGWNFSNLHFYSTTEKKVYYGSSGEQAVNAKLISNQYLVASSGGDEIYIFDINGRHLQTKNALTGAVLYNFNYDSSDRILSIVDSYNNVLTVSRNGTGQPTSITSPYGQVTTLGLNASGYLTSVTNPNNEIFNISYYGSGGLMQTFQKPKGQVSTMTYDSDGFLFKDQLGNSFLQLVQSTNVGQRKISTISAEGVAENFVNYTDASGAETSISNNQSTGPSRIYFSKNSTFGSSRYNNRLQYTESYTDDERMSGMYARTHHFTKLLSGTTNQITDVTQTVNWGSNTPGADPFSYQSLTKVATTNSKSTTSVYSPGTGLNTITSPLGRVSNITTDTFGKMTSQQFASFAPVNYGYDSRGRLSSITQSTRTTSLAYNVEGFLSSVTNPANQVTGFGYDLSGRLVSQTLPDTRVINYNYDLNGNLSSVTPPTKPNHSFAFNNFDLTSSYTPPALGTSNVTTQYSYDNDKRLTLITRPDAKTISFGYDAVSGLLSTINTASRNYTYTYADGLLSTISTSNDMWMSIGYIGDRPAYFSNTIISSGAFQGSYDYTLNNDFLMATSTVTGFVSTNTSAVNFAYDNDNLLTTAGNETLTRSPSTGLVTGTTLDKIKEVMTYDPIFGELATYTVNYHATTTGTPTTLFSQSYTRDSLGRIITKSETVQGVTNVFDYTYDSAGRLTTVLKNSAPYSNYVYDGNSNRTSGSQGGTAITATYDAQDRLTNYNGTTYAYNLNGEMTLKTVGTVKTTPNFDELGNLKSIFIGTKKVYYTMDGLNRRLSKKVGTAIKAYWVYDEQNRVVAQLNATGAILM